MYTFILLAQLMLFHVMIKSDRYNKLLSSFYLNIQENANIIIMKIDLLYSLIYIANKILIKRLFLRPLG